MTRPWRTVILSLAVWASIWVSSVNRAWACPNCKEAVSLQGSEVANAASGYNWSVVFMLAVPFSIMGTGAFMVRRAVKRGLLPEM
jgi:hypothetical protein